MRIFISWSGDLSHRVAEHLREFIPNVIQATKPYVSSEDTEKGTQWFGEISEELGKAEFGVVVVTRENRNRPWLLFEAGALSRGLQRSRVAPFLVDLRVADLTGPLAQLNASLATEADARKLLRAINSQCPDDRRLEAQQLDKVFDKWWPDLSRKLEEAKSNFTATVPKKTRSDTELLEEIVENTRAVLADVAELQQPNLPGELVNPLTRRLLEGIVRSAVGGSSRNARADRRSMRPRSDSIPSLSDLSGEHQRILGHIIYEQGQQISELARHTGLSEDVVQSLVNELGGWIEEDANGLLYTRAVRLAGTKGLAELAASERRGNES